MPYEEPEEQLDIEYDKYSPILEEKKDDPRLVLVENWLTKILKKEREEDETNKGRNMDRRIHEEGRGRMALRDDHDSVG